MKKTLLIYGIGIILSKILVFLMVPIYTRIFSLSDYGYYDVIISDVQMLVSISFIEIWSGILRYMFSKNKKEMPIKCYLKLLPFTITVYIGLLWMLSNYISIKYPFITFLYGVLYLLFTVANTICRGYEKNKDYVISGLIYTFISCVLSIIFSTNLRLGIRGLFIAQCIGYIASILFVEIRTKAYRKAIKIKVSKEDIKNVLQYSLPLMVNSFSFLFLGTYNKNIILKNLGENESGLYAFALKFSAIFSILISIYSMAWQEQAFINAESDEKGKIYSYYINKFLKIIGLFVPCFIAISYIAAPIIGGSNYEGVGYYIPLSISAAFISELSGVFSVIIAVNKKTIQTLISTFAGAIVNVLLVYLLIDRFGVNGSNIALNIGFLLSAFIRFKFAKRDIFMVCEIKWLVLYIIEIFLFSLALKNGWEIIYGVFALILWFILNREDIKNIYNDVVFYVKNKEKIK